MPDANLARVLSSGPRLRSHYAAVTQSFRSGYAKITQHYANHYAGITQFFTQNYAIPLRMITQFITQLNYAIHYAIELRN